jgi:hypothetical protein
MIPRDPDSDGPELVPPAALLRMRNALSDPPSAEVRAHHLAAVATASRQRSGPMGRYASRSARVAAAVVASLAITTGLAAAQVLPQPAQRLLSNVSDRFAPSHEAPVTTVGEAPSDPGGKDPERGDGGAPAVSPATTDTVADPTPPTTATRPVVSPTTIPGPTGPGSPTDPTDPGPTDPTTTTTVDPGTTTTTVDPGTTTTTTDPGSTTTTTEAPSP